MILFPGSRDYQQLVFSRNRCHNAPCGVRNRDANWVRNFLSLGKGVCEWEARSAMQFVSPATWKAASGEAWQASMHRARAWIKYAAVFALDASRREVQATVGVLSQPDATCACWRFAMFSRTIQCISSPTISKSKFVIVPVGFFWDTNCCCSLWGNQIHHTIGGRFQSPPNHTPPAPSFEASQ